MHEQDPEIGRAMRNRGERIGNLVLIVRRPRRTAGERTHVKQDVDLLATWPANCPWSENICGVVAGLAQIKARRPPGADEVSMEVPMMMHPAWIVVADGGGARFFVRRMKDLPLEELVQLAESADLLDHRDRTHDDVGHGRHAILARTTPHEREEQTFLRHVAGQIDRAVIENAVGSLVICAPPRALGLLRDFISENARRLLVGEIAQDFVKETPVSIDARLKRRQV